MNRLLRHIGRQGLRQSRGRTIALFLGLTLAGVLVASEGFLVVASRQSPDVRDSSAQEFDLLNARSGVRADEPTNQPHVRWHVDYVLDNSGDTIAVVDVAKSGPNAPRPPQLADLPAPGTVLVSPALQKLIDAHEFTVPGRVVGPLPRAYVGVNGAKAMMVGWDYDVLVAHVQDTHPIVSFDGRTEHGETGSNPLGLFAAFLLSVSSIILFLPTVAFVAVSARIGAQQRAERFMALRLIGMTRAEVRRLVMFESALVGFAAGIAGTFVCSLFAVAIGQAGAAGLPGSALVVAPVAAVVLATAASLVALFAFVGMDVSPLGVVTTRRRRIGTSALTILAGVGVVALVVLYAATNIAQGNPSAGAAIAGGAILLVVFVAVTTWDRAIRRVGRWLGRRSRGVASMMAGRRMADQPRASYRGLGVLGAVFFAVAWSTTAAPASNTPAQEAPQVGNSTVHRAGKITTPKPSFEIDSQETTSGVAISGGLATAAPLGNQDLEGVAADLSKIAGVRATAVGSLPRATLSLGYFDDFVAVGRLCDIPGSTTPCADAAEVTVLPAEACNIATDRLCSSVESALSDRNHASAPVTTSNDPALRALASQDVFAVVRPDVADRLGVLQMHTIVWAPHSASRAISELVATRPGLSVVLINDSSDARREAILAAVLILALLVMPLFSGVALAAADRTFSRRRALAASWALGVPRSTLRRAALLETLFPLVMTSLLAIAGGIGMGLFGNKGRVSWPRVGAGVGAIALVGLVVWVLLTVVVAPIVSRTAAARSLRTT